VVGGFRQPTLTYFIAGPLEGMRKERRELISEIEAIDL
jgi:hypothetical protein